MGECFLSICIPMYNCENYIEDCLESIASQKINDKIEVIIVDDCSKDRSLKIAKKVLKKNSFFGKIIIHESNLGGGHSRNDAINASTGEFLLFLDSDDYLPENCLNKLFVLSKENSYDMIYGDYSAVDRNLITKSRYSNAPGIFTNSEVAWQLANYQFKNCVGSFIVRRNIVIENKIMELSGNKFGCDQKINYLCVLNSKIINVTNINMYLYRCTPNSEMNSLATLKRFEQVEIRKELLEYIELNFPNEEELILRFKSVLIPEAIISITRVLCYSNFKYKNLKKFWEEKQYKIIIGKYLLNSKLPRSLKIEGFLQMKLLFFYKMICRLRWKIKCCLN